MRLSELECQSVIVVYFSGGHHIVLSARPTHSVGCGESENITGFDVASFPYSLPEFESMVEAVLENTLCNILMEANRGEVNLTARPRVIALPPSRINRTAR